MFHFNYTRIRSITVASFRLFCTGTKKISKKIYFHQIINSFKIAFFTNVIIAYDNQISLIGRIKGEVLSLSNGFDSFKVMTATKRPGHLIG